MLFHGPLLRTSSALKSEFAVIWSPSLKVEYGRWATCR